MSDEKKPDSSDTFYLPDADDKALREALDGARKSYVDRNAVTKVPCPWCHGDGMITPEKRAEWEGAYPELSKKSGDVA